MNSALHVGLHYYFLIGQKYAKLSLDYNSPYQMVDFLWRFLGHFKK